MTVSPALSSVCFAEMKSDDLYLLYQCAFVRIRRRKIGGSTTRDMDRVGYLVAVDVACEFLPFTDLISDVILLVAVWPSTKVVAPSDVSSCGERALW